MNHKRPRFIFVALVAALLIAPMAFGQSIFLDRPDTEPDADPGVPITDPLGDWYELNPGFSSLWNCLDWKRGGYGVEPVLFDGDYLQLEDKAGEGIGWYFVKRVTITITVDRKICACVGGDNPDADCKTDDDCTGTDPVPDGTCECTSSAAVSYLEYVGTDIALGLFDPASDTWHEVYPTFSQRYNVVDWIDGGDGRISASDQIRLVNKADPDDDEWYHVDRVSWDIEVVATDLHTGFKKVCSIDQKPPCDDMVDPTNGSRGSFAIVVSPRWRKNMTDCPGYTPATGLLESPKLFDPATVIGRSAPHLDGALPPDAPPGTPVGKKETMISDATFSLVPTDKDAEGFAEGPPGTREVHTEIQSLELCDYRDEIAYLPCVRAGDAAIHKTLPVSPGEVESKSASGQPEDDFPAESFFNMFVEVDLPQCGSVPFPGAVLYHDDPLLVTNNNLLDFPPEVVYKHGSTPAVPVYFTLPDPGGKWLAGEFFGWLVLAGHGVGVTLDVFDTAMYDVPSMDVLIQCADMANLACWSGCLTCEDDPGCATPVTQPGAIEEETNFVPVELALVQLPDKINMFQSAVQDILLNQVPLPQIVKIRSLQEAINAILAKPGSNVVIFGHGAPGFFKIGDENLGNTINQNKFTTALKGQFKSLTLYGCEVSKGAKGQAFLKKLTAALQRPVHAWDGKVYAFGNDLPIPSDMQNRFYIEADTDKKEIPAVTEWGMVVMVLLVLAAGTVVIRRVRAGTVQA